MSLQGLNTYKNNTINATVISTTGVFLDDSTNTGSVNVGIYNDNSINSYQTTTGVFSDLSINAGNVTVGQFFNSTKNEGNVQAATFTHTSVNSGNTVYSTFNEESRSYGTCVSGYFEDVSINNGNVTTLGVFSQAAQNFSSLSIPHATFNDYTTNNGQVEVGIFNNSSLNLSSVSVSSIFQHASINKGILNGNITFTEDSSNEGGSILGECNRKTYYWYSDFNSLSAQAVDFLTPNSFWVEVSSGGTNVISRDLKRFRELGSDAIVEARNEQFASYLADSGTLSFKNAVFNPRLNQQIYTRSVLLSSISLDDINFLDTNTEIHLLGVNIPIFYNAQLTSHTCIIRDRFSIVDKQDSDNVINMYGIDYPIQRIHAILRGEGMPIQILPSIQIQNLCIDNCYLGASSIGGIQKNYLNNITFFNTTLDTQDSNYTTLYRDSKFKLSNAIHNTTLSYKGTTRYYSWYHQSEPTISYPQLVGGDYNCFTILPGYYKALGRNNKGQCGSGNTTDITSSNINVGEWKKIVIGQEFAAGIKLDNTLWAWGSNKYGQLGRDPNATPFVTVPNQIGPDSDWYDVAVGSNHLVAVRWDGLNYNSVDELKSNSTWSQSTFGIYGFGSNLNGQLGTSVVLPSSFQQVIIREDVITPSDGELPPIVQACRNNTAYCIDRTSDRPGTWYIFGDNTHGQIPNIIPTIVTTPTPITHTTTDGNVSTTHNFDMFKLGPGYIIVKSIFDKYFGCGRNDYGQLCGNSASEYRSLVSLAVSGTARDMCLGSLRVVTIDTNSQITMWGKNVDTDAVLTQSNTLLDDDEWVSVTTGERFIAAINVDGDSYIVGSIIP